MITRKEAKEQGLFTYFTGQACKHGHIAPRYTSNKNCSNCTKANYESNKEAYLAQGRAKYHENLEYEHSRNRAWKQANKGLVTYQSRKRQAHIKRATPKWADETKIKEIYRNRPPGYHVDHEIPLQGYNVCGLHVENNLQYLTISDNLSKSNRFIIV